MSEQIPDERIRELLTFTSPEEENDEELHAILKELVERRKQAGYSRQQRLDFLLRVVKDSFPEIARELRELYREQDNALYYARRDAEHYRDELHDLQASTETP